MLTVRELLSGLDVRLLSGEAALDLPVRWVHISELPDPTPWLSGGELLLTTGMQLKDAGSQRKFVEHLAECDGCDRYLDQIRSTVRTLASLPEHSLPAQARDRLLAAFRDWQR